jgi:hypothetical protein
MPIRRGGFQESRAGLPTRDTASGVPSSAAAGRGGRLRRRNVPQTEVAPRKRTGVVFVHGIGAQTAGQTLLEWSRPITKLVAAWVDSARATPAPGSAPIVTVPPDTAPDPTVASHFDFDGGTPSIVELHIPQATLHDDGDRVVEEQIWVLTEAWWGSSTQPPSLGSMTSWLRKDFGRVIGKIENIASGPVATRVDRIERFQASRVKPVLAILWALGWLLLLPYALFRSVPIATLRDAVAFRQIDSFLVDWFGDMRVLLHDPAQAANIRDRLAESITTLLDPEKYACERVVVVAHSGGALVSFTTLTDPRFLDDPAYRGVQVDALVTIGQGLGLAWSLENTGPTTQAGDRLMADIGAAQHPAPPRVFRWYDFWGSFDPAPAGAFAPPTGVVPPPIESTRIRNRMSLLTDHGGYGDNEEEFIIPLLRVIDTAGQPTPAGSRFYRDSGTTAVRLARRYRRITALAVGRIVATVSAALAIGTLVALDIARHAEGPRHIGNAVALLWSYVPGGNELIKPVFAIGTAIDNISAGLAWTWWPILVGSVLVGIAVPLGLYLVPRLVLGTLLDPITKWMDGLPSPAGLPIWMVIVAPIVAVVSAVVWRDGASSLVTRAWSDGGPWVLGLLGTVIAFVVLTRFFVGRWEVWDADERWRSRSEPPLDLAQTRVKVEFGALLVILVALSVFIATR